jgi:protein TonB
MRRALILSVIFAAAATSAIGEPSPAPTVGAVSSDGFVTHPVWKRFEFETKYPSFYPAAARPTAATGRVVIICSVTAAGDMTRCEVSAESPAGYGFGDAALKLVPLEFHLMPQSAPGRSLEGLKVRFPITFQPPSR